MTTTRRLYNTDWGGWSDEAKPYDQGRPFHRIHSPSYDEDGTPPSGRGYDCGCRNPDTDYRPDTLEILTTIGAAILLNIFGLAGAAFLRWVREQLLRTLPGWVGINREGVPESQWPGLPDPEKEVEGVLIRSFQTWTDVPVFQWHRWYDWNFHLVPARGYKYVRGRGNHAAVAREADELPVVHGETMECEWDCGVLGDYDFRSPGGRKPNLHEPGPMFEAGSDWAWPMAGQYVWIVGRWIYDCGHAHNDQMKSEIHPCKAVATARWEAVKFDEHEHHVPAIQFMFFACRMGGYIDAPTLTETDYEFIVDLPPLPAEAIEYPIGINRDFPINTLVVRPRLLMKADYRPFDNAHGPRAQAGATDPRVELLPPRAPGELPKQVKVKIPLTELPAGTDTYGVLLSLGWHDPNQEQRDNVKRVVVHFVSIQRFERHEIGRAEWQVKFGVNGRWRSEFRGGLGRGTQDIPLNQSVTLHLALDDHIAINCHGMEENAVGDVMHETVDDRELRDGNTPYTWFGDIDQPDNDHASGMAEAMLRKMAKTFEDQNEPLGFIDPGQPIVDRSLYRHLDHDQNNPLTVRELTELTGPGAAIPCRLTAHFTDLRDGDEALVADPAKRDYVLHYTLQYFDQGESES